MTRAQEIQELQAAFNVVAFQFAKDNGLAYTAGSGSYDDDSLTTKITFSRIGSNGLALTREARDWDEYAKYNKLGHVKLGDEFTAHGRRFTITGWSSRSSVRPIIAKRDDGKTFKFPRGMAVALFPVKA